MCEDLHADKELAMERLYQIVNEYNGLCTSCQNICAFYLFGINQGEYAWELYQWFRQASNAEDYDINGLFSPPDALNFYRGLNVEDT